MYHRGGGGTGVGVGLGGRAEQEVTINQWCFSSLPHSLLFGNFLMPLATCGYF